MNQPQFASRDDLVEDIARIEHEQWVHWSKSMAPEVPPATREKWQKSRVDYDQLNDDIKEADRIWARKVVSLLRQRKLI